MNLEWQGLCFSVPPWHNDSFFPRCQSSAGSKFDPTQLLPLRKCVPMTGQVRGQCGHAVIVPHITKVLWCQHNHIVCTVTAIWRAALLGQSFPIYGALYVRKWVMARYVLYSAKCVPLLQIQQFNMHTLNLSSLMTSCWICDELHLRNRLILDHPQSVPRKPKCSPDMMQCSCRTEHKKCGNSFTQ